MISPLKLAFLAFFLVASVGCSTVKPVAQQNKIFVVAGQTYPSTRNYYDSSLIPEPAGFSEYVTYNLGEPYKSYAPDAPKTYGINEGLMNPANWGAGIHCVMCNLKHKDTKSAIVNIGLDITGPKYSDGSTCTNKPECNVALIVKGKYNEALDELAGWAKAHPNNPVLLRIGYEFDGSWNGYDPEQYKAAFKYIKNYLTRANVQNVEYVFHSFGYASRENLEKFFPEPDAESNRYVDWIGYSYFTVHENKVGQQELDFARELGLPVFLGEVAPHTSDCKNQIDLAVHTELGKKWIDNFMLHLEKNSDVIRGIAYINEHWSDKEYAPMWDDQQDHNCGGFFSQSNSRLTVNPEIEKYWADALAKPLFDY